MPCERGRTLHAEFTSAVAARATAERGFGGPTVNRGLNGEVKLARQKEERALMERTFHISGCAECWHRPPR
jgi:hypothetical protein